MRKCVSLLAAILVLLSVSSAFAGEEIYARQIPQNPKYYKVVYTSETISEVHITPFRDFELFTDYNPADPLFLSFPVSDDMRVESFDTNYVQCLGISKAYQAKYQVDPSDSWEEFFNKAEKDEYIILDGSDGMGAYIDPENWKAYGMIATKEFARSSKLNISLQLDYFTRKTPQETIASDLTDMIVAEVKRVYEQMHYETTAPFWSEGKYVGFKMLDPYDMDYMLKFTYPKMSVENSDGRKQETDPFITRSTNIGVTCIYLFDTDCYVKMNIDMDSNPFPLYKMRQNDPDAMEITLPNGKTWYVYLSGFTEDGNTSYVYASVPLKQVDHDGRQYYMTLEIDCRKCRWSSMEVFLKDLSKFDAAYEEVNAFDDPYIPSEPEKTEVIPETVIDQNAVAEAENESWICPDCGSENNSKFCAECGRANPAALDGGTWTCTNGHEGNTGNFCGECGMAKPE